MNTRTKLAFLFTLIFASLALTACGDTPTASAPAPVENQAAQAAPKQSKALGENVTEAAPADFADAAFGSSRPQLSQMNAAGSCTTTEVKKDANGKPIVEVWHVQSTRFVTYTLIQTDPTKKCFTLEWENAIRIDFTPAHNLYYEVVQKDVTVTSFEIFTGGTSLGDMSLTLSSVDDKAAFGLKTNLVDAPDLTGGYTLAFAGFRGCFAGESDCRPTATATVYNISPWAGSVEVDVVGANAVVTNSACLIQSATVTSNKATIVWDGYCEGFDLAITNDSAFPAKITGDLLTPSPASAPLW